MLTELIFSGILKDLSDEEIVALLSTLDVQNRTKADDPENKISENFWKAIEYLVSEANKL